MILMFIKLVRSMVSGLLTPPCSGRGERHDVAHTWDVESHIWSTIWLTLQSREAGSMSASVSGGDGGGARRPRDGSWRNRLQRARSRRRWHGGTTSHRSTCLLGARRHGPVC